MRPRLLVIVSLLVIAGCVAPSGRPFTATFPEVVLDPDVDVVMEEVPVTLYDATGLVVSLEILPERFLGAGWDVEVAETRMVLVQWGGGSCLDQVRIALSRVAPAGFAIDVEEMASPLMLGCAGVGISRGVVITLNEDVLAEDFVVSVNPQ